MRILLDECVPKALRRHLPGYICRTVPQMGWASVTNGKLLRLAEPLFDAFLTVDKSIPFQQQAGRFDLGIVVIRAKDTTIDGLMPLAGRISTALEGIEPGQVRFVVEEG